MHPGYLIAFGILIATLHILSDPALDPVNRGSYNNKAGHKAEDTAGSSSLPEMVFVYLSRFVGDPDESVATATESSSSADVPGEDQDPDDDQLKVKDAQRLFKKKQFFRTGDRV